MGCGRAERPAKFPLWWNPLFASVRASNYLSYLPRRSNGTTKGDRIYNKISTFNQRGRWYNEMGVMMMISQTKAKLKYFAINDVGCRCI